MEDHPVPQDVTGFQFKLVGDMTLKQFGYLAAGAIMAWIFISTPWYAIIKIPLAFAAALSGIAFAFVPINDRPLDVWVANFFKAIYKPTYLIWKKSPSQNEVSPLFDAPVVVPTVSPPLQQTTTLEPSPIQPVKPTETPEVKEPTVKSVEENSPTIYQTPSDQPTRADPPTHLVPPAQPVTPPETLVDALLKVREEMDAEKGRDRVNPGPKQVPPAVIPDSPDDSPKVFDVDKLEELRRKAQREIQKQQTSDTLDTKDQDWQSLVQENDQLTTEIEDVQSHIDEASGTEKDQMKQKLLDLAKSRDDLANRINTLQKTLSTIRAATNTSPKFGSTKPSATTPVRPASFSSSTTLSLSDVPNVISGLVKYPPDSPEPGQPIEGAIVLIKDSADKPIRALKTNRVGQFVTNTPLDNGYYVIEVEKPGFSFEPLRVDLVGKVLPLLEIFGKPYAGPV